MLMMILLLFMSLVLLVMTFKLVKYRKTIRRLRRRMRN